MSYRDRIRELRRVPASQLEVNPQNWRTHPKSQQKAMQGILQEVGYADALLVRELEDGSLQLIDGHLRAEISPDQEVPVLILDVTEDEANKILVTHDPIAAMASTDEQQLTELIDNIQTDNHDLQTLLDSLNGNLPDFKIDEKAEPIIPESYQVIVDCQDEKQQQEIYEQLKSEGLQCRVLML